MYTAIDPAEGKWKDTRIPTPAESKETVIGDERHMKGLSFVRKHRVAP